MVAVGRFLSLLFIFTFISLHTSFSQEYKLDVAHSTIGFKIKHMGFSYVRGRFNKYSGNATFDMKTKTFSKMLVTIDAESIDTNEPDRDKHLRSSDFFDIKKYQKLIFEMEKTISARGTPKKIIGFLTIRGIKKKIVLNVQEWGGIRTDPWGTERLAFEAEAKIDRSEFGLNWNKPLAKEKGIINKVKGVFKKAAGQLVGEKVILMISVQGIKVGK